MPPRQEAEVEALLGCHNLPQAERIGQQQRRGDRQRQRQLITDKLRRAAQSAEQRIFVIRGPARQRNSVNPQRGDRQHEQDPHIQIGELHGDRSPEYLEIPSERDHRNRQQGHGHS